MLHSYNNIKIHIRGIFGRYNPVGGRSYIELPAQLKKKVSLLNIQNDDHACLSYCILANKHVEEEWNLQNPYRPQCYEPFPSDLNMQGVSQRRSVGGLLEEIGVYSIILTSEPSGTH